MTNSRETALIDENGWRDIGQGSGSMEGEFVDWLTFKDLAESVFVDVKRIPNHPLVPPTIPIYGFIYDVKTGQLIEVPSATEVCRGAVPAIALS